MSSLRTKLLIWSACVFGFLLATPFLLPKVIPFLVAHFSTNSVMFVTVHVHAAPFITCVGIWVAILVCARISFLHDKRSISGR